MHRQAAPVLLVRNLEQLLEELSIQDRYQKIEACVVIRNDREQCGLLLAESPQIKFIRDRKSCHTVKIELLQS